MAEYPYLGKIKPYEGSSEAYFIRNNGAGSQDGNLSGICEHEMLEFPKLIQKETLGPLLQVIPFLTDEAV